jgi:hypothetical protein
VTTFFAIFMWFNKSAKNAFRPGHKKSDLIFLVSLLLIFSFGFGLSHGTVASKKTGGVVRNFVLVTAGNDSQIYGELLFSFDKFFVIRENEHNELTFLPSDKVTSIKTLVSIPSSALGHQTNKR